MEPLSVQIQRSQLSLLGLQIEWQQLQNQILRQLVSSGVEPTTRIIQFNKLAREWNALNASTQPPPGNMYS